MKITEGYGGPIEPPGTVDMNKADLSKDECTRILRDLREAYEALNAGTVIKQKMLADGLIAPAIRRLEKACK